MLVSGSALFFFILVAHFPSLTLNVRGTWGVLVGLFYPPSQDAVAIVRLTFSGSGIPP